MRTNVVSQLRDNAPIRIAIQAYLIAVAHVFHSNEPEVRQTGIDTLAIAIPEERRNAFIIHFSKSGWGFHRHSVVIVQHWLNQHHQLARPAP